MRTSAFHLDRASWPLALLVSTLMGVGPAVRAEDGVKERAARFETDLRELGRAAGDGLARVPVVGELARRIRVSGDAVGVFLDAGSGSQLPDDHWTTWDARIFADVLIAEDVKLGERVLAHAVGVSGEWQLFRIGRHDGDLGELYLDVQGLLGSRWLDVQIGRFLVPVGESYLRFGKGGRDNPFVTNAVGGPWWWDEGVRIHGADERGRFGYTASFSGGETARRWSFHEGDQATLKLFARPASWLYLSASGLYSGPMGEAGKPAEAALWLGETWGQGVPNDKLVFFGPGIDGIQELDDTLFLGADAILTHPAGARLWLSYGSYEIDSSAPSAFDRRLHTWLAELVLEGRLVASRLRPFYLALRAAGLGTYDADDGYVLDSRYGDALGNTMRSLERISVAVGWRMREWADLKVEYTVQDAEMIRSARAFGLGVDDDDFLIVALGLHF